MIRCGCSAPALGPCPFGWARPVVAGTARQGRQRSFVAAGCQPRAAARRLDRHQPFAGDSDIRISRPRRIDGSCAGQAGPAGRPDPRRAPRPAATSARASSSSGRAPAGIARLRPGPAPAQLGRDEQMQEQLGRALLKDFLGIARSAPQRQPRRSRCTRASDPACLEGRSAPQRRPRRSRAITYAACLDEHQRRNLGVALPVTPRHLQRAPRRSARWRRKARDGPVRAAPLREPRCSRPRSIGGQ